ncbi:MAG: amidohydrolase family protein [Pseudomonadota bacterium]
MKIVVPNNQRFLLLVGLVMVLCAVAAWSDYRQPHKAHVIFTNAEVLTMDALNPKAAAVAVHGDQIIAVGDEAMVRKHESWFTRSIDLEGQTLMPGLVESHTHPVAASILYDWLDVSGFSHPKPDGVWQALQEAVAQAEPGEWIYAFGLDPLLTAGIQLPDRKQLDEIAPDNPLFILSQVMHTVYFNSALLAAVDLDESAADPQGGHFDRYDNGSLNGVAHENAIGMLIGTNEQGLFERLAQAWGVRKAMISQYEQYAAGGITTIGVLGPVPMFEGYLGFLEHVATRRASPLRTIVFPLTEELEKSGYELGYQNEHYQVTGVKLHLDGSPWTGGMATREPYEQNEFTQGVLKMSPDNIGLLKYSAEEFTRKYLDYHEAGWQIAVHTHGERAHQLLLDTVDNVLAVSPREDHRHRMEHLGLLDLPDIKRAAQLGVTPSFFIDHIYFFGTAIEDVLVGKERAERFMALQWATEHHERVSLHMDTPATPINPWRAMRTATTRIPRFATAPLNESQLMSQQDALEAMTIDAAWQLHMDDEIGSIEVGKQADFVVLSKNPLALPADEWMKITAQETWLAGERVWQLQ